MYILKWAEEAAWAIGIAVAVYALEIVAQTERVDDWSTYLIALGGGIARVAAAILLNEVRKLQR